MTRPGGVSPRSHSIQWASNLAGSGGGMSMSGQAIGAPVGRRRSDRARLAGMERPRRLVLASASPARLALLRAAGLAPEVVVSGVSEEGVAGLAAADAVRVLAERKADAVAARLSGDAGGDPDTGGDAAGDPAPLVLACDSLLSIDGEIRGKPASADEARAWWRTQRGRAGVLATGHAVVDLATGRRVSGVAETVVRFGCPTDAEIDAYIATGEPLAVAGACTIEGYGAPFVAGIEGDHGTVMGLSLPRLRGLLADLGIAITELWVPRP
jgi:septum formation protein